MFIIRETKVKTGHTFFRSASFSFFFFIIYTTPCSVILIIYNPEIFGNIYKTRTANSRKSFVFNLFNKTWIIVQKLSPVFSVSFICSLILSHIEIHSPCLFINALQQYKDQHLSKILQDIWCIQATLREMTLSHVLKKTFRSMAERTYIFKKMSNFYRHVYFI